MTPHDSRESEDNFVDNNYDPYADMISGNQESIIRMYREAIQRIEYCITTGRLDLLLGICDAINKYHPMYEESWKGFPEGSEVK